MNKGKTIIGFGIIILLVAMLSIVFIRNSEDKENVKAKLIIKVVSLEKIKDGTIYVTAEIVNNDEYKFEDNKIFIVENSQGVGGVTTSGSASGSQSSGGGGVATINDKPKNVDVKELSGTFKTIGPNKMVRIGFSVPFELTDKELLFIMQGLGSKKDGNMKLYTITKTLN